VVVHSVFQTSLEDRLAFLEERRGPLLGVRAGQSESKGIDFDAATRSKVHVQPEVDRLLGGPQGHAALGGDLSCGLQDLLHQGPAGTTLFTSPIWRASAAEIILPVKISSLARLTPIARGSRCVPPKPGIRPRLISGRPNLAVSAA